MNVFSIRLRVSPRAYLRIRQENNRDDHHSPGIWRWLNVDILDVPPFSTWRRCYESHPRSTLIASALFYAHWDKFILYGWSSAWCSSLSPFFLAICLSLGNRREGEMSAYSVFNPNCERLLGQMTAEHFERDVLRRRID
ncbi:hypothetical protein OSTOST_18706 [Ostertagia ostertagi]